MKPRPIVSLCVLAVFPCDDPKRLDIISPDRISVQNEDCIPAVCFQLFKGWHQRILTVKHFVHPQGFNRNIQEDSLCADKHGS